MIIENNSAMSSNTDVNGNDSTNKTAKGFDKTLQEQNKSYAQSRMDTFIENNSEYSYDKVYDDDGNLTGIEKDGEHVPYTKVMNPALYKFSYAVEDKLNDFLVNNEEEGYNGVYNDNNRLSGIEKDGEKVPINDIINPMHALKNHVSDIINEYDHIEAIYDDNSSLESIEIHGVTVGMEHILDPVSLRAYQISSTQDHIQNLKTSA